MNQQTVLQNKALYERASAFEFLPAIKVGGGWGSTEEPVEFAPLEYLENGDVVVRIKAEGAKEVVMTSSGITNWKFQIPMQEIHDGVFEAVISADKGMYGNITLTFVADGTECFNPSIPSQYYGFRLLNCIEIPDPETPYIEIRDVPHGAVTQELFWSETVKQWLRCMVYTPPMYQEGGEYPVLYLQHGAGENETCWTQNGKLPHILDNCIAEGKAVPFIVVMNHGMMRRPGENGINDFAGIEGIITEDCRNYIESHYRVKKDKWNRAIAGLSLGSMQACYIGMRHPELYGSIGTFTFMRCRDKAPKFEDNPHLDILKDKERFGREYKLFFRSIGGRERTFKEFEEDDAFLATYGIDQLPGYRRLVFPNENHNWNCWRRALYFFAQEVFR